MYKDVNKGITSITYNHLNLPTKIVFTGTNRNIVYLYDATGQKVKKVVTNGTTITTTDYLTGYQYENAVLKFFPTAEGYVNNTVINGINNYNYVYNYTDHLGNIRLSYSKDPATQQLKILSENNYYPFGMKHEKYNVEESVFISGNRGSFGYYKGAGNSTSSVTYKYKYNGKELQDELGLLNLYDYGARNYDPAIGRWMNMDGFSEKYFPLSPYTYAVNNPMFFVDPDGNYIEIYYGQDGKSHYTYNYVKNRNYSEIKDPFLADAYKALDALYKASNIEIDGKEINVIQTLMDDTRELSVVETTSDELQSTFAKDRDYISKGMWNARGEEGKILGTVHFNTSQAIRYDDINDTNNVKDFYDKNGKLKSTVKTNSPTALLGHEFVHAFNWSQNKTDYINRVRDTSTRNQTPWFKNAEEARTTTLSSQININLGEPSRSNYHAEGIKVPNVLSNKPSN